MLIEIIVTNCAEALTAAKHGADRLELINAFENGGLSPQLNLTLKVCAAVNIPVNVMLRPHAKSFVYTAHDITQILQQLEYIKTKTKAHGIVFGALNNNGTIDCQLLKLIIKHKGHLSLTFHRAIDASRNPIEAYAQLLNFPEVDLVLTSGGAETALAGVEIIRKMQQLQQANLNAEILIGSGITPDNISTIIQHLTINQIHLGSGVRTNNQLDKFKFDQLIAAIKPISI